MGTAIFIAVCAGVFFVFFVKSQDRRKHEMLYKGINTEEEIVAIQARQRNRLAVKLWGAVIGALLGSFIGLAAFGGAMAGTIPAAILGWYIAGRN